MKKKSTLSTVYAPQATCISVRICTLEAVTEDELFRYVRTVLTGENEPLDKFISDRLVDAAGMTVKRTR